MPKRFSTIALALLLLAATDAPAASDPVTDPCARAALRAAGRNALAELRCHAGAGLGAQTLDECLESAEVVLLASLADADVRYGCALVEREASALEKLVDRFARKVLRQVAPEPSPSPSGTPQPIPSPSPAGTPAPSASPPPTSTPQPSATAAASATPTPTATPTPAATPTRTPTPSPAATGTASPAPSPTAAHTPSPRPILDLGHSSSIRTLQQAGDRVLSEDRPQDAGSRWVLWDTQARAQVWSAYVARAYLAGDALGVEIEGGVELRGSGSGELRASLPGAPSAFGLAQDGSYLWIATTASLGVYSGADGAPWLEQAGDHSAAHVFAAPGELRVAGGPAGPSQLERISLPGGSTSPGTTFQGEFLEWFTDGGRFLTSSFGIRRIYSSDGALESATYSPSGALRGVGDFLWKPPMPNDPAVGYQLSLYSVTEPDLLVAAYSYSYGTEAWPTESAIGLARLGPASIDVVHLTGSSPSLTQHAVPSAHLTAFASDGSGKWSVGSKRGVVYDDGNLEPLGAGRSLSHGQALSVAGTPSGRVAVALAGGTVLVLDLTAAGAEVVADIPFQSSHVELSADGTILAMHANDEERPYLTDNSLRVVSLPDLTEIFSWVHRYDDQPKMLTHFSLSADGARLGLTKASPPGLPDPQRSIVDLADGIESVLESGGPNIGSSISDHAPVLSPTGRRTAIPDVAFRDGMGTRIYLGGELTGAVPGLAVAWLDDERLLVNRYERPSADRGLEFAWAEIYDPQGAWLADAPLPETRLAKTLAPNVIYSRFINQILDVESGAILWAGPAVPDRIGAVAGGYVVYPLGRDLVAHEW